MTAVFQVDVKIFPIEGNVSPDLANPSALQVQQGLERLQVDHPRANETHDGAYLQALRTGVAVDGAEEARPFRITVEAKIEPG